METIKLIELTDEYAIYEFYPENKKECRGVIKFNRTTKDYAVLEKNDMPLFMMYASHVWYRVKNYDENNDFKEYDLVAWG